MTSTAASSFLIQIAVGPVQGFIATARRSRDLWFGSYVLSEIAKAVAKNLSSGGAKLIFPAPATLGDLDEDSPFSVANIVTAEVEAETFDAAKQFVEEGARHAARERWRALCDTALDEIDGGRSGGIPGFIDGAVWRAQIEDVVELYAGIVPSAVDYADANARLRELLANRKNTRSFDAYKDPSTKPKSSLDGAQSTALAAGHDRARRRLGIDRAEQLDTAGTVKRVVGRRRGFVPSSRVAAAPWIARIHAEDRLAARVARQSGMPLPQSRLEQIGQQFDELAKFDLVTRLRSGKSGIKYDEYPWIRPLPFDGELLYASRVEAVFGKDRLQSDYPSEWSNLLDKKQALLEMLETLVKRYGTPPTYYALLLADGDQMGKLIDNASRHGADAHREISRALAAFAAAVPATMKRYYGACIYSGGDDVLGVVALSRAVACAHALARLFDKTLSGAHDKYGKVEDGQAPIPRPTLSVGLAVAHMLEPLTDVRGLASEAERLAKGNDLDAADQRNALAIVAKPRGAAPYRCRVRWDQTHEIYRLRRWIRTLSPPPFGSGALPRGLPLELDELWQRTGAVFPPESEPDSFLPLWRARVETLLARKRESGGDERIDDQLRRQLVEQIAGRQTAGTPTAGQEAAAMLRARLDRLVMAQWLSGPVDAAE